VVANYHVTIIKRARKIDTKKHLPVSVTIFIEVDHYKRRNKYFKIIVI